jgi:hypothetical protein
LASDSTCRSARRIASYLASLKIIATESNLLLATRFYSIDQGQDLLAYLEEIEASADPAHLDLVGQVYGPTWPEPFTALYEWRENSGEAK